VHAPDKSALDFTRSGRKVCIGVGDQELGTFQALPAQLALVLINLGSILEGEQLFVRQTLHLNIQFPAFVDASAQVLLQFCLRGIQFVANHATMYTNLCSPVTSEIINIIYQ